MKRKTFLGEVYIIFETENFWIGSLDLPHIDRADGGHIIICPHEAFEDRTKLTPTLAKELMMLSMVVGEAMKIGLNRSGIDVKRINYQENGNWSDNKKSISQMHIHLYGRAESAKIQIYGQALSLPLIETGFYDNFQCLTKQDIENILSEINKILKSDKYRTF